MVNFGETVPVKREKPSSVKLLFKFYWNKNNNFRCLNTVTEQDMSCMWVFFFGEAMWWMLRCVRALGFGIFKLFYFTISKITLFIISYYFTTHLLSGQNGPIPSIFEIFCPETLFRKNIAIYHFLWYSSLVSSSTIFFKSNVARWHGKFN